MKMIPVPEDEAPFVERQVRQPREVAGLPVVDAPDFEGELDLLARLQAEVKERQGRIAGIKEAAANLWPGEWQPTRSFRVGKWRITASWSGRVSWKKVAQRFMPPGFDTEPYRGKANKDRIVITPADQPERSYDDDDE